MVILTTQKHLKAVVRWYFLEEPVAIVYGYGRYARALMEVFPIPFLLLTLVSPWKNIRDRKKGHGFNLSEWFERLVLNMISRTMGAIIRMIAILFAITLQCVLLACSTAYLLIWISFPAITITATFFLVRQLV
jgi:hypothetical protein